MGKKKEETKKIKAEEETESKCDESAENKEDTAREEKIKQNALEKENSELKEKLAEENDKYLRILAEYDNYKKRTSKEKEDIYFNAKSDILKKILPIADNLERAEKFSSSKDFEDGVKMIIKQFFETLEAMDVHEIEAEGKEFDPNLHEAVFHDEKEGIPENTVTEVLQKGYISGEKVLRHAMVKVTN